MDSCASDPIDSPPLFHTLPSTFHIQKTKADYTNETHSPNTMDTSSTPARVYCLSPKQSELFITTINKRRQYVEPVKRHLDPESLKSAVGVSTLVGIKDVWVDEDPMTRGFPHHLISYNAPYQREWGNSPLYGNVFVILSKKAWEGLPAEKRLTDDQVKELTLQPVSP